MTSPAGPPAKKPAPPAPPLWRQAFDAAERAVTPRAETFVRTPTFSVGVTMLRRAEGLVRGSLRGATARAWHLVNLPAGTDVSKLRAQIGALDREVRRLALQLEAERRRSARAATAHIDPTTTEKRDAAGAESADGPRPRPARRGAKRPPGA
jgi:outer membrane murein-binding lipoprotein Lpp